MKRACSQLFCVAALTVRSALRLRLFVCLLFLLLCILFGVPALVRGDGTALSRARILLSYTLWLSSFALGIGVLWTSCAAVAAEIEGRQMRLVAVKPVRGWTLWLGKWLGIMALAAVLLALIGVVVTARIALLLRDPALDEADRASIRNEILVVARCLEPRAEDITAELDLQVREIVDRGSLPDGIAERDIRDAVRRQVLARRAAVAPGETRVWVFDLPRGASAGGPAFLQYRMASSRGGAGRVAGTWRFGKALAATSAGLPVEHTGMQLRRMHIPEGAIGAADGVVSAAFSNEEAPRSLTAVFHGPDAIELRLPCGAFGPNMARALLVVLFLLGSLAALGLTMSTLFSFPVATFAAFGVAAMIALSRGAAADPGSGGHAHGEELSAASNALVHAGETLAGALGAAARPVARIDPLGRVAAGVRVNESDVAIALALSGLAWPGLLGAAGAWRLARREIGAA